ncbi:hypothetical protein O6H91_12G031900 [Diphasiastrum complanatum]|uniref:Uncharacterized protein n=1 Tax=Diphasiastrum complanatum TaxID=34168 RepID=A0ACC2C044_DIPCM|nr:hypothetical protein O6H91_12G031900 [Diphasiastrum complanatum]
MASDNGASPLLLPCWWFWALFLAFMVGSLCAFVAGFLVFGLAFLLFHLGWVLVFVSDFVDVLLSVVCLCCSDLVWLGVVCCFSRVLLVVGVSFSSWSLWLVFTYGTVVVSWSSNLQ